MKKKFNRLNNKSTEENENFIEFLNVYKNSPIPDNEILENLFMYIQKKDLSHLLFINEIYKKIINIHGNIVEFGTRWGRNLALFVTFRLGIF